MTGTQRLLSDKELAKRQAELDKREAALEEKEEKAKKRWREGLYDRIPVSVRTMDIVIGGLVAAIVICLVVGIVL